MNLVMLAYPNMTQLDLTGPLEVFSSFKELSIELIWKTTEPIKVSGNLTIIPTHSFETCSQADILFVPGGGGQLQLMEDAQTLSFLKEQAKNAQYITSVCTGSLVLAAAGLLTGYKATCHWLSLEQLSYFGVIPISERVVIDGNRVTGAGVTSGIDFGLALAAKLFGEERAKQAQLRMEYDPQPSFNSGSPKQADANLVELIRQQTASFQKQRETVAKRVAQTLKNPD